MKKYECIKAYPGVARGTVAEWDFDSESYYINMIPVYNGVKGENYFKNNPEYWQEVKEKTLPKTWWECVSIVKPLYYIKATGQVSDVFGGKLTQNHVPTEKHAQSVLAYCQLLTIIHALNRLTDDTDVYSIYYHIDNDYFYVTSEDGVMDSPIRVKGENNANHLIKYFEKELREYFMI